MEAHQAGVPVHLRSSRAAPAGDTPERAVAHARTPSSRRPARPIVTRSDPPVSLLVEDPDLAQGLSSEDRRLAERLFRAPLVRIEAARWNPPELDPNKTFGLILLDALVGRRVVVGRAVATELLGPGDALRPWEEPLGFSFIPPELNWRVFRPGRAAVIDERATRLIGARPQLLVAFSGRLLRRARSLAYLNAISHLHLVEDKVRTLLWHLASTYGQVTPQGVRIPFRLTHEVLGEIVGAKRPSVTLAMTRLHEAGAVLRDGVGWLLTAEARPAVTETSEEE
jgi:CRP/FNR family transcriptional regulator, cyclic AMP receptor protein